MNTDDFYDYFNPACVNLDIAKADLDNHLGIAEYTKWSRSPPDLGKPMSSKLKALFKALQGPHGATILKAFRIQKGLDNGCSAKRNLPAYNQTEVEKASEDLT